MGDQRSRPRDMQPRPADPIAAEADRDRLRRLRELDSRIEAAGGPHRGYENMLSGPIPVQRNRDMENLNRPRKRIQKNEVTQLRDLLDSRKAAMEDRIAHAVVYSPVFGKRDDSLMEIPKGYVPPPGPGMPYGIDTSKITEDDRQNLLAYLNNKDGEQE